MLEVKKVGGELAPDKPRNDEAFRPVITALSDGGFVVAWGVDTFTSDASGTSDDYSVKAQVFGADGATVGSPFMVNTQNAGVQSGQRITGLADGASLWPSNGGFVATWVDGTLPASGGSFSSIKAQLFAADGSKVGSEFLVNAELSGSHYEPTITGLADGGFVATWTDDSGALTDQVGARLKVQVFDPSGAKVGSEFAVNTLSASGAYEQTISRLANGGFVLAWRDHTPLGDFGSNEIYAQMFNADGTEAGGVFLVNTQTGGAQYLPTITGLSNGGFVVSWTGPYDVRAQAFGADGTKLGAEFVVNTETAGGQYAPKITGLADGRFVVTWTDGSGTLGDGDRTSIKAQLFGADGSKVGGEFLVNTQTAYEQQDSTITALANGDFVVSWWDLGSAASIKAQIFSVEMVAPVIDSNGGGDSASVSLAENAMAVATAHAAGAVTYTISGGADAALFQIDAATGALSFKTAPNFEAPADAGGNNVYDVTVTASEAGLSDSQAIAVTVTNVNETPVISSNGAGATAAISVAENRTLVAAVAADDPDASAALTYSVSGTDAAFFTINASTGQLSFKTAPNFEAPADAGGNNVYDVVVRASDGAQSDTQALAITVVDRNEAPAIASNGGGASGQVAVQENSALVAVISATDPDAGAALRYAIVGGSDAGLFKINGQTGALSFRAAVDFETPRDAGQDNVYDVIVRASDGALSDTQALAITVKDVLDEVIAGTSGADRLTGAGGDDMLKGGAGIDFLSGNGGNDVLDGGKGADRMEGGAGNDTYIVDDARDVIFEKLGEGTDTIKSSMAFTLGSDVENLALTGSAGLAGSGNGLANLLIGNTGDNTLMGLSGNDNLRGGAGNDTLVGGEGKDVLTGGRGRDFFVFDTAPALSNADKIIDFNGAEHDKVQLSKAAFSGFTHLGLLTADAFYAAAGARSAHDASDRGIYDTSSGKLYYDADGLGGQSAVQIAVLGSGSHPALTFGDILIIA